MIVDLHCHSCYSDGELTPEALLNLALANQVDVLALTDHDTLDGYASLQTFAQGHPIHIIPGLECSVTWQRMELHILGYQVQPDCKRLQHFLQEQFQRRWVRALTMCSALKKLGI